MMNFTGLRLFTYFFTGVVVGLVYFIHCEIDGILILPEDHES